MPSVHGRKSLAKIQSGIDNRREFDVASVHGVQGAATDTGWMTGAMLAKFKADRDAAKIDFTVLHYATPVLWHTEDGWVENTEHYSASTTATMGRLRVMIHNFGFYS